MYCVRPVGEVVVAHAANATSVAITTSVRFQRMCSFPTPEVGRKCPRWRLNFSSSGMAQDGPWMVRAKALFSAWARIGAHNVPVRQYSQANAAPMPP